MKDISKLLEHLPEIDLKNVSENGDILPVEIAKIRNKISWSEGKEWDIVYVGGKITLPESLKQFHNYTPPHVIVSDHISITDRINMLGVSTQVSLDYVLDYRPIMKIENK
jgi:hypothetical protein